MSVINSSPPAIRHTPASNDRPVGIWAAMEEAARRSLGAFLLRQRWYSAKDAGTPAVTAEWLLPFQCHGLAAMVAVWKITPPGRPQMSLFIPLALVPKGTAQAAEVIATLAREDGDHELVDAFSADAFVRAWVTFQLEGSAATAASKQLRAGATDRLARLGIGPGSHWSIRRVNIEQSNTSIRIGERAILKVYRKLDDGVHPELEVGRHLASAGFRAMPAVLGWMEQVTHGGEGSFTLSVLHEFVRNEGDGWQWMLQQLTRVAGDESAAETRSTHRGPCGAELLPDGGVRFRLWAPSQSSVSLELEGQRIPLRALEGGWHELVTQHARAGSLYRYRLADDMAVPDPASRFQPEDIHGPSEVIDPGAYLWGDGGWRGRPWEEAVVYELHVGAFTAEGTFRAAIERLDHLVGVGVTAIEIMPIADFPGMRNWGYDGVALYAPDSTYGRPEALKELIDAAHGRGLMVLLDVVYNHFGPEGAYIHAIAPETFTERHKTPWGAAINTDGGQARPVREFFIHNALYWIEEFHFDGLRLDAVHAILDDGPKHLLEELAERVRDAAAGRHIHLILENEENEASRLVRDSNGQPRWYSAQWNDDVHHVLHVAATGETSGYYADYQGDTAKLGRALAEGFAFQGELMPYRGRPRGQASQALPPAAFVAFIQNHDQIGNRAFGDRITQTASVAAVRAVAAVYLLLPQIPMLFMGEEWGAAQPFPFFCDFEPQLAAAVRDGRRAEFARFPEFQDPAVRERIPDPTALETFTAAKLNWDEVAHEPHASWLDWYRCVLAVRHRELVPRLSRIRGGGRFEIVSENAVVVRWPAGEDEWVLEVNLSDASVKGFSSIVGRVLWEEGQAQADGTFGPHTVRWSLQELRRGLEDQA
jgi:malto-oligosyltrehalose trehalohydrolase